MSYAKWPAPGPEDRVCDDCGATVYGGATDQHDKFHADLARTAQQAHSASMWTRPIGGHR